MGTVFSLFYKIGIYYKLLLIRVVYNNWFQDIQTFVILLYLTIFNNKIPVKYFYRTLLSLRLK